MIAVFLHNYQLISKTLKEQVNVYTKLDEFLNGPEETKFALVEMNFQKPRSTSEVRKILIALKDINHILYRSVEHNFDILMHTGYIEKQNNITAFICGLTSGRSHDTDLYWLYDTHRIYQSRPDLVDTSFNRTRTKPYYFDVLYGQEKRHRLLTKKYIEESSYSDVFLQSQFTTINSTYSGIVQENSDWWEDEIIKSEDDYGDVVYMDLHTRPSQIIPFKIYNKCAYSIVCETDFDNRYSFFTEKIAKPLIAGRLFIVISGMHYLKHLRQLGFKTFGDYVDESYDEIEDLELRVKTAILAATKLIEQPQEKILKAIEPIVKHNQEVMQEIYKTAYVKTELELERLVHLANKRD